MSDDVQLEILKNQLNSELGIDKYKQGLKRKMNIAKGMTTYTSAKTEIENGITPLMDDSTKYFKELRDSGLPYDDALSKAKDHTTKSLKALRTKVEAKYPGYEEAIEHELRKHTQYSGLVNMDEVMKRPRRTRKNAPSAGNAPEVKNTDSTAQEKLKKDKEKLAAEKKKLAAEKRKLAAEKKKLKGK
jgi:hypothetical protein